jgi:hypothetical protein
MDRRARASLGAGVVAGLVLGLAVWRLSDSPVLGLVMAASAGSVAWLATRRLQ